MAAKDDEPKHPLRVKNPRQEFIYVGDKDFRKLQKKAWDAWWWPKEKKSGILWLAPDGKGRVMLHGTSSDHHSYDNALAQFRAAGLDA